MLLGKRPRLPMRRTASMAGLPPDPVADDEEVSSQPLDQQRKGVRQEIRRGQRKGAANFSVARTASFLAACGLCRRRLAPGRDIFMYRGDMAFCSLECRQQQINLDERKEKCSLTSMKTEPPPAAAGSEASGGSETVAAA